MKALSGRFTLNFGILGASVAASIILISACEKSVVPPDGNRPILVIFKGTGVPTKAESETVKKAFEALGEDFCNVDYYVNNSVQWHVGHLGLKMTAAVHSEAAASPVSADPNHLLQKAAFTDLDQAQQTFSTINSTPTPTPSPP